MDRPIIFTGENVRAILDGRKTQTRRIIKDSCLQQAPFDEISPIMNKKPYCKNGEWFYELQATVDSCDRYKIKCPYGVVGDRLWVRETWRCTGGGDLRNIIYRADGDSAMSYCGIDDGRTGILHVPEPHWAEWDRLVYKTNRGCNWRSPIHMFKWAARLWLEITGIRVERVRNITDEDAKAEGVIVRNIGDRPYHAFKNLWNSIHGDGAWERNDWVWVVEFKVQDGD
jgi:hypothetical protein